MNITRLAEKLKVTPKELLSALPSLGFAIGARAQKVNDSEVDKITRRFKQYQKLRQVKTQQSKITEIRQQENKTDSRVSKEVTLPETIIVKDLAERLQLPIAKVMGEMMKNGIMASLNERLDLDTATIIAEDLGYKVSRGETAVELNEISQKERLQALLSERHGVSGRPPVVVVMGHVDHGKTKLLDTIRQTHIVEGESGGITQHIGAYQTEVATPDGKRLITFLDTPGHEAFKAMRSRGGQIADLAILVVAADDGLKPQTLESLSVIQKEHLPFIVAINKIDKESADVERVKKELTEINLTPEDWGGKTVCQPISAKSGQGIPELLELILLTVDLGDLKADSEGAAVGTIVESHMDKNEGPVATVLIQAGTLMINDLLSVGQVSGKVKALKDWTGTELLEATPGMPVKILGLKQVPHIGEIMTVETDKKAFGRKIKDQRKMPVKHDAPVSEAEAEENKTIPSINIIIKADVLGSLEAIAEAVKALNSAEAQVRIARKGLGYVTEADILTAEATQAEVISFHLQENKKILVLAEEKKVSIKHFDVIYHLLEHLKTRLENIKETKVVRKLVGELELLAIFKTVGKQVICGGKIIKGKAVKPAKVKILRQGEVITYGDVVNLQMSKEDVSEAVAPNEIGLALQLEPVLEIGDRVEFFIESK